MVHRRTRRAEAHAGSVRPGASTAPGRVLTAPRPGRVQVLLWRLAATAFLATSCLSAALLSSSLAADGAGVLAAAPATDAVALGVAALLVAVTARRTARVAAAAVTTLQLLAVSAARQAGDWPAEHGSQGGWMTRLLCAGAVAVVTLAVLIRLDDDTPDSGEPNVSRTPTLTVTVPGSPLVHHRVGSAARTRCGLPTGQSVPAEGSSNCMDCGWLVFAGPACESSPRVHLGYRRVGAPEPQALCDGSPLPLGTQPRPLRVWTSPDAFGRCGACDRTARLRGVIAP